MHIVVSHVKTKTVGSKQEITFEIDAPDAAEVLFRFTGEKPIAEATRTISAEKIRYPRTPKKQISFIIDNTEVHIYCLIFVRNKCELYKEAWVIKRGEGDVRKNRLTNKDVKNIKNVLEKGRSIRVPFTPENRQTRNSTTTGSRKRVQSSSTKSLTNVSTANTAVSTVNTAQARSVASPNITFSSSATSSNQRTQSGFSEEDELASLSFVERQEYRRAERKLKSWSGAKGVVKSILGVIVVSFVIAGLVVGALWIIKALREDDDTSSGDGNSQASNIPLPLEEGQCISLDQISLRNAKLQDFVASAVPCDQVNALYKIAEVRSEVITECPEKEPDCWLLSYSKTNHNYLMYPNVAVGQCVYGFRRTDDSRGAYAYPVNFSCDSDILSEATLRDWVQSYLDKNELSQEDIAHFTRLRIESIGETEKDCWERASYMIDNKDGSSTSAMKGFNFFSYEDTSSSNRFFKDVCVVAIDENLYGKAHKGDSYAISATEEK